MKQLETDSKFSNQYNTLQNPNFCEQNKLAPLLKWAGGKETELKFIIPNLPQTKFQNYYEPFIGGGAVYTALQADQFFINDKSFELINLYKSIKNSNENEIFNHLESIISNWNYLQDFTQNHENFLVNLYHKFSSETINELELKTKVQNFIKKYSKPFLNMFSEFYNSENFLKEINLNIIRKIKRMKDLEKTKQKLPQNEVVSNLETAFKSAFYMQIRYIYNLVETQNIDLVHQAAFFLFIRNYAYSGMFRYNSKGEFNVPYGGLGYNRKNFQKKINYLKSEELQTLLHQTSIENLDFEEFLIKHNPTENDFIFLDPPYDSEFSTYAQNEFTREDQTRLANFLIENCKAKWMMVIKHTDFIYNLYNKKGLKIQTFDKKYLVSFMNRNDKDVVHLMITNY